MGLGPPPKELKLIDWGRPYGLLPSRFTPDDYYWLSLAERFEEVRRLNALWQDPKSAKYLSKDAVMTIVELRKEAKKFLEEIGKDGNEG